MDDDLTPNDPFGELPEELRRMLEQLTGPDGPLGGGTGGPDLSALLEQLGGLTGAMQGMTGGFGFQPPGGGAAGPQGPVDWRLARSAALQRAAEGDRSANADEVARAEEALRLAEHWLDGSTLPAPPDAGRLSVMSRGEWVDAALAAMRPLVEPVAAASTSTMTDLARSQFDQLGEGDLDAMGLGPLAGMLQGLDPGAMLAPLGATLAGLQAGQVLGELAQTLLTGYELGLPTASRSTASVVAPNVAATFDGYGLDPTEVAVALALTEAAHRRLFHAVPWLEGHVHELVAAFAEGVVVDAQSLQRLAEEMMSGVDPSDPESMEAAMERASGFRMEPTEEQLRTLARLQGVTALVGAWTRREVERAAAGRLTSLPRVEEVLRRRRASRADGGQLLGTLLGLDLQPDDPRLGEEFVAHVEATLGPEGLRRAVAHPENLPDLTELAQPAAWLRRVADEDGLPDDVVGLLGDLGDAPVEPSAEERATGAEPHLDDEGPRGGA